MDVYPDEHQQHRSHDGRRQAQSAPLDGEAAAVA